MMKDQDSPPPRLDSTARFAPRANPFKEQFWRQLGGQPGEEDRRLMDPAQNPATRGQTVPLRPRPR